MGDKVLPETWLWSPPPPRMKFNSVRARSRLPTVKVKFNTSGEISGKITTGKPSATLGQAESLDRPTLQFVQANQPSTPPTKLSPELANRTSTSGNVYDPRTSQAISLSNKEMSLLVPPSDMSESKNGGPVENPAVVSKDVAKDPIRTSDKTASEKTLEMELNQALMEDNLQTSAPNVPTVSDTLPSHSDRTAPSQMGLDRQAEPHIDSDQITTAREAFEQQRKSYQNKSHPNTQHPNIQYEGSEAAADKKSPVKTPQRHKKNNKKDHNDSKIAAASPGAIPPRAPPGQGAPLTGSTEVELKGEGGRQVGRKRPAPSDHAALRSAGREQEEGEEAGPAGKSTPKKAKKAGGKDGGKEGGGGEGGGVLLPASGDGEGSVAPQSAAAQLLALLLPDQVGASAEQQVGEEKRKTRGGKRAKRGDAKQQAGKAKTAAAGVKAGGKTEGGKTEGGKARTTRGQQSGVKGEGRQPTRRGQVRGKAASEPRPVAPCNFYLRGYCKAGDDCTFSHAGVPKTISTVCKFWRVDPKFGCAKGDKCPFAHDLSVEPCQNLIMDGKCSFGDRCKFSHRYLEQDEITQYREEYTALRQRKGQTTPSSNAPEPSHPSETITARVDDVTCGGSEPEATGSVEDTSVTRDQADDEPFPLSGMLAGIDRRGSHIKHSNDVSPEEEVGGEQSIAEESSKMERSGSKLNTTVAGLDVHSASAAVLEPVRRSSRLALR